MFSQDGTLKRLGLRAVHNRAGPLALPHHRAEDADVSPKVVIDFVKGNAVTTGTRIATGTKRPAPPIATAVNACFVVDPIIRGHTLRTFVEDRTAQERYTDVAKWLHFDPLVHVQRNLRSLRTELKAAAENPDAFRHIDADVRRQTGRAVTRWNEAEILSYVNLAVLAPLDKGLILRSTDVEDATYSEIAKRTQLEERRVGLAGLRQLRRAAVDLCIRIENEETHEVSKAGAIPNFEKTLAAHADALKAETDERNKAAGAAFQTLWKVAAPFFAEDAEAPPNCPICATPLGKTAAGDVSGIREHISNHLGELADYARAKKALDDAAEAVELTRNRLDSALSVLAGLLGEDHAQEQAILIAYHNTLNAWTGGNAPKPDDLQDALGALVRRLDATISNIVAKQGDHTYAKAKNVVDRLQELKREHAIAVQTQAELRGMSDALNIQAGIISAKIRTRVQALLDKLQNPMNEIYRQIQGRDATPVRLELPDEEDTTQQRLSLVIDFADNRVGVQPSGYLSDSQIHSLALGLWLAAIKQFNSAAPIIALDDIVTSYDADHRRTVAGLISDQFSDSQIVLTTHDEQFFRHLKDMLPPGDWQFTRIIGIDPLIGPRFADQMVSDDMIQAHWKAGRSAANEMRQAEEEWLLDICRGFGVSVRIRPLERAYSYHRGELAAALAGFLRDKKLEPPNVPGVGNRFLTSLQRGEIENFGSHFQDNPQSHGSIGDEQARWDEFISFRSQFVCPNCSGTRFKRPVGGTKPVCLRNGCESQFDFVRPSTVGSSLN